MVSVGLGSFGTVGSVDPDFGVVAQDLAGSASCSCLHLVLSVVLGIAGSLFPPLVLVEKFLTFVCGTLVVCSSC